MAPVEEPKKPELSTESSASEFLAFLKASDPALDFSKVEEAKLPTDPNVVPKSHAELVLLAG